jgi:hypothetical protein
MTFTNGAGESRMLRAGEVHYPAAAFTPGATVVLTLRVASAEPFVYTFADTELAILK